MQSSQIITVTTDIAYIAQYCKISNEISSRDFTRRLVPWKLKHFLHLMCPALYSFASLSHGSVTVAVAPCGMVNFHIHLSPS